MAIAGREFRSRDPHEPLLAQLPPMPEFAELDVIRGALSSIRVHPYFSTGASWADLEHAGMRAPTRPEPGARLNPTGSNLAAALHSLREESPARWQRFLDVVKRVFPGCRDIRLPSAVRGYVEIAWHQDRFEESFDAAELSDGTLAFLAGACALLQARGSVIAIDEPERSLHPEALYRLLGVARMVSDQTTVILATQSDRLLGFLDDIPESIVVVRAGDRGTEIVQPGRDDREDIEHWLREFSLADMRAELEAWGEE